MTLPFLEAFKQLRKAKKQDPNFNSYLNKVYDEIIVDKEVEPRKNSITREVFYKLIPSYLVKEKTDLASNTNMAKEFYNYRLDSIQSLLNKESEEYFTSKNGQKPWIVLNQLFKDFDLPFKLNNPEELSLKELYTPVLTNIKFEDEVKFSEISSGEKVLVSLVFWLFNSSNKRIFPRLLLLDEPDAHLHPSMTKQFLTKLENILCEKYNVRVILTTHSPSTVALAPEESIFLMSAEKERIKKVEKDVALKILTAGVPSFSVNYENRRQVFVESANDVMYYEKLYEKLSNELIPEISLSFISSGDSRTDSTGAPVGNCGQVKNICKLLRNAGNQSIWGIIDRDEGNISTDNIVVLGNKERYAIENFLFDPLLLSALLLREKIINRKELGLSTEQNYTDLKEFNNQRLQTISDYIINKITEKFTAENDERTTVTYLNKSEIKIPTWYLNRNGHKLEEQILEVFPKLGDIKRADEKLLKLSIIDKIIDDIPGLIPMSLVDTFKSVQK